MSFDDIPIELQRKPQWVCWGKDKVPMNPNARTVGSPTSPKTWGSFDEAVEAAPLFNGIGFCFTKDDPFVGIDFDKCIKDGVLDDWVDDLLNELNTYTEYSPSGVGLHAYLKAPVEIGRKSKKIEVYSHSRYFTITGNVYRNTTIKQLTHEKFKKIITRFFKDWGKSKVAKKIGKFDPNASPPAEMLAAFLANSSKFKQAWERSRVISDGSDSAYDGSICYHALYAGWNDEQVTALLCAARRKWGDAKEKLKRPEYFSNTIQFYKNCLKEEKSEKEALETARLEISKGGQTPEDLLAEISSRFRMRVPIEKIIKRGREPSEFFFQIDGIEIFIGEIDILINPREFRKRFLEIKEILIPIFKANVWEHILELITQVQVYEDTGNRLEETLSSVREYLDSSTIYDDDTYKDALTSYRPFNFEGNVWISIQGWQRSVDIHRSIALSTRRKLLNRLVQAGFQKRRFSASKSGSTITRWYMGIPTEEIFESVESEKPGNGS